MVKIEEKDNKVNPRLYEWKDVYGDGNFSFYVTDGSTKSDLENINKSGLMDLINQLYEDTNIPDPGDKQLIVSNALQQKYGLKRTYKDIINELRTTQPSTQPVAQNSETIYAQLGDKTLTPNIVISNIKTKDGKYDRTANIKEAKDKGRVYTMEVDSDVKSFSNPWASFDRAGTIKTSSTKQSVQNYIDWLTTDKFINIKPERRAFILDILKSGKLKGKQLQYYAELKEPSHATALDYLINKYDWSQPSTQQQTEVKEGVEEVSLEEKQMLNALPEFTSQIKTKSGKTLLSLGITNPEWKAMSDLEKLTLLKCN